MPQSPEAHRKKLPVHVHDGQKQQELGHGECQGILIPMEITMYKARYGQAEPFIIHMVHGHVHQWHQEADGDAQAPLHGPGLGRSLSLYAVPARRCISAPCCGYRLPRRTRLPSVLIPCQVTGAGGQVPALSPSRATVSRAACRCLRPAPAYDPRCAVPGLLHSRHNLLPGKPPLVIADLHGLRQQVHRGLLHPRQLIHRLLHMGGAGRTGHARNVVSLLHHHVAPFHPCNRILCGFATIRAPEPPTQKLRGNASFQLLHQLHRFVHHGQIAFSDFLHHACLHMFLQDQIGE